MPSDSGTATPARTIPLCVPQLTGREWEYLKECLDTNFVSSVGPFVDRLEQEVARCIGLRHGVATTSGTSALHVALLVAGVQPGDEVLVSTLTFIAPANAVRYVGAWPVFVDAEPDYWQMDPAKLRDFLERRCQWADGALHNRETGRRIRAILPVDVLGHPADLDPIVELARQYDLAVVEDASESLGARYRDEPIGRRADVACFSFNGNKVITAGGGGMIVTNNTVWADRARYLATQAKDDPIEFVHNAIGFNYRLTNIQAAVGLAQFEHLDEHVRAKRRIAAGYTHGLDRVDGVTLMREAAWAKSAWWLFTILIDGRAGAIGSRTLLASLRRNGVEARPLWQPCHLSPAHRGCSATDCSVAERLSRTGLCLPSSVGLTPEDQEYVVRAVTAACVASTSR